MKNSTVSLRKQLTTGFTLLAIAPLLILGLAVCWSGFSMQFRQVSSLQQEITKQAAVAISAYIHEQEHQLRTLLKGTYLPALPQEQQAATISKFLASSKENSFGHVFTEVAMLDRFGREQARVSRQKYIAATDLGDRSSWSEFTVPLRTGRVYYSPVAFSTENGEPNMKIALPVVELRSGSIEGVLVGEISLKFLWRLVDDMRIGRSGTSYVVDGSGRMVAHPNSSLVLQGAQVTIPDKPRISTNATSGSSLLTATRLNLGQQPLQVITELPVAELFSQIRVFLVITASLSILTLIGAMLLRSFIINRMVLPIESLAATVKGLRNGGATTQESSGETDEIDGLTRDVTTMSSELLKFIQAYESEKSLLTKAIDSLSHPFYVIDAHDHTIKVANKAAQFGLLTSDSKCYALTHQSAEPCNTKSHPCPIEEVKKTGKPVSVEHKHKTAAGLTGIFEVHAYPIFDTEGEVMEVIEYVIDITMKKKMEENLWQAREAGMAEMAAEVLHNIGNAITPAKIAGLNLLGRLEDNPMNDNLAPALDEFRQLFDASPTVPQDEKRRLARITELLPQTIGEEFTYFMIEMKKICDHHENIEGIINLQHKYARKPGFFEEVDLNRMVEDALKIIQESLRISGVMVLKEFSDVPRVRVERARLLEAIIALLKNGQEAVLTNRPGNRLLTLATETDQEQPGMACLRVTDNGHGFSKDEHAELFNFGAATKPSGGGLSLHAVANYLNRIHGTMTVNSDGHGQGATFVIRVPVGG